VGPSFVNLSALPVMAEGEMVRGCGGRLIGSLDIVLGEIESVSTQVVQIQPLSQPVELGVEPATFLAGS
jgi:hypothetical protein